MVSSLLNFVFNDANFHCGATKPTNRDPRPEDVGAYIGHLKAGLRII